MSERAAEYDVAVVGSGVGGAVVACRVAEAGHTVVVLERGDWYEPGGFPRDLRDVDAVLWRQRRGRIRHRGLYDVRFLSGVGVVTASGVGGGSLIFANVLARPNHEVFTTPEWPDGVDRARLDPYYERFEARISPAPVPPTLSLAKRDAVRAAAAAMAQTSFDASLSVTWTGPQACQLLAECEFGCQVGAKRSMDRTHLQRARQLGGVVHAGALVSHVAPSRHRYVVHYLDLDTGQQQSVHAKAVVLAAGTLGSTEILLRSRDVARTLPGVSPLLGVGFSANGDFIGTVQGVHRPLDPQHGPDVTTLIRYASDGALTLAAPTYQRAVMAVLASFGQPQLGWLRPLLRSTWPRADVLLPVLCRIGLLSRPLPIPLPKAGRPDRLLPVFAVGRDDAGGRVVLKAGRANVLWDYRGGNRPLIRSTLAAMEEMAEVLGGTFAPAPWWQVFGRTITVHPLGGCRLSDTPRHGVVSPHGEVHGYPRLFVADGSVVPTALGIHPAATIGALAERTSEAVCAAL